jgi:hypothetical protein
MSLVEAEPTGQLLCQTGTLNNKLFLNKFSDVKVTTKMNVICDNKLKKAVRRSGQPFQILAVTLFVLVAKLLVFFVFLAELINTSCCVNQLDLTGIERMRCVRYFKFYQRILFTVFPFDGFFGCNGRPGHESVIVRDVFKNYQPVFFGMNVFSHGNEGFI